MLKTKSWLICMLLFAVLLVACGDDDDTEDAATSIPAVVETTAPSDAADSEGTPTAAADEPTEEAEMTSTSEPTEPAVTPTEEAVATATEEAVATATEDEADETPMADSTATGTDGTPEADETPAAQAADPEVEAELFEIVLAEEGLPEGWTGTGVSAANDTEADPGFCNAEPFPGISERLASIDAEFEQSPEAGPFLIQNLAAYPEDLAIEAMEYAREITSDCTEWTDDEGIAYTLEPQDGYPQFGDESFVLRITFEVPGVGEVPGEFVFARVGGLLTLLGYVDILEIDPAQVEDLANLAVEKMQDADF